MVHSQKPEHAVTSRAILIAASVFALAMFSHLAADQPQTETHYYTWSADGMAIDIPLGGLKGDPTRGRILVIARDKGNCLACHIMPIPEQELHGTLGPPLNGLATRMSAGQIRLSIVDRKQVNPYSPMPGYYRDPKLFNQVLPKFENKTILSAQEVEDVVAYLLTLQ